MSIRVMSDVWAMHLPDSQKIVLLALADCANDEGHCWPSMATLAKKCSKSERTVQGVIKDLAQAGHLTRNEVIGRGCNYYIHPRSNNTPAVITPPQGTTQTPAAAADKPSRTVIVDKAKALPTARAKKPDEYPKPEWADPVVWSDFLKNRKNKKKPNTATAYKRFCDDIARLSSDEWPPGRLLAHAASEGWAGIYEPMGLKNGQSGNQSDGMGRTGRAIERLKREISSGSFGSRTGTGGFDALPTRTGARFIEAEPNSMFAIGHDRG